MRNDLSMHRIGLLEFLNRVGHKIVDLDDDRIIRKTHVISSKFFLRGGLGKLGHHVYYIKYIVAISPFFFLRGGWGNWDIMFTI